MSVDVGIAIGGVQGRLQRLRDAGRVMPVAAAQAAWFWIAELAKQSKSNAAAVKEECNALFRLGTPPTILDSPINGALLVTTADQNLAAAAYAVAELWMPWQGRPFRSHDAAVECHSASAMESKLLWPLYSMCDAEEGNLAFGFKTYLDAGKSDPDREVLLIDYADIESDPTLVIRDIRKELVEIVDSVFLGKILYRSTSDKFSDIGYFALRT